MARRILVPVSIASLEDARRSAGAQSPSATSPSGSPLQEQTVPSISQLRVEQATQDCDPDTPLPSVEQDFSPISSRQHTPGTEASHQQPAAEGSVAEQLDALSDLRLSTPAGTDTPMQETTTTPSIRITPSASPFSHTVRNDSFISGFERLHVNANDENTGSNSSSRPRKSASPSPSRRRRSGSGINREPHRIEDEAPLPAPFHKAEVQKALSDAKACVSNMVNVLASSNLHLEDGSSVRKLHQQALDLTNQQLPSSRIVGLIGDSGVGKSSLINSLLDTVDFVRASSSGTACTCAVTEYMYHTESTFKIEVDYFTSDELKKQYEELLRAYRDYDELPEASKRRNINDEERGAIKALEKKADLAEQTFSAIFGEKLETKPGILTTMDFDRAIRLMIDWTALVLPPASEHESYHTMEQCSSRLRELTSESDESPAPSVNKKRWPLIRKLRVYLNAYILSKGLIIADLPGLRDHNSARKAITERYVRQCHQIFAVARIDRAITDESVKEIFELARRADLSKIDVVCTRAEDIQVREAKHDWVAERVRIEELEEAINATSEEADSLKEEIEDFETDFDDLTHEDRREFEKLQQNLRKAERSKENHEFDMLRLIVGLRNAKVSDRIKAQYRDHPVASLLKIFCVSNKTYWDHRHKSNAVSEPHLQLSGIIQLRQYCIGIVAESRLRAAMHFIKDQVPAFLASVGLWVEAGSGSASAEKKQQVLDTVSAVKQALDQMLSPASEVRQCSSNLIGNYVVEIDTRIGSRSSQWSDSAHDASLDWQGWHHSSYKAFCSNYGTHCTNAIGSRCWNTEALEQMKRDMKNVWSNFASDSETQLKHVLEAVEYEFDRVLRLSIPEVRAGSGSANSSRLVTRSLEDMLYHRKDLALHNIEDAIDEFRQKLLFLKTNALAPVRTAFVGRCMERAYHAANMEYGAGSDRRRKNLITGRFGSQQLFTKYQDACRAGFLEAARSLQTKTNNAVSQQIQLIEADLQILRDENVVLENERNPGFRRQVETGLSSAHAILDEARRVVMVAL